MRYILTVASSFQLIEPNNGEMGKLQSNIERTLNGVGGVLTIAEETRMCIVFLEVERRKVKSGLRGAEVLLRLVCDCSVFTYTRKNDFLSASSIIHCSNC